MSVTAVPVLVIVAPSIASGGSYGPTRWVLVDYMPGRTTDLNRRVFGIHEIRLKVSVYVDKSAVMAGDGYRMVD